MAELTHFDQLSAQKQGFFHETFDGNDTKHRVFKRMDVFSTKYGHESVMILWEWTFFTKYGHENIGVSVKNRKQIASFLLLWPIIWCSFHGIYVFLTKYRNDSRGFFSWKIGKKMIASRKLIFFWQHIDTRAECFLRMDVLITQYVHNSS